MSIDALTQNDAGITVDPHDPADWDGWVSASSTRNYCEGHTLVDWLQRYGREQGFTPDIERAGYDPGLDFGAFAMAKGHEFEAAVIGHLATLAPLRRIAPGGWEEVRSLARAHETFAAMVEGVPIIAQGILRNPETRTYGAADLLVRSDWLNRLAPGTLAAEEESMPAPGLAGPWHYRVIDIKYSSLHLDRKGQLTSDRLAYMAQVYLYNEALGRLQGLRPAAGYVLGRQCFAGKEPLGGSCLERLGPVPMEYSRPRSKERLSAIVSEALAWQRRLRAEGADWWVLPEPAVPELRPVKPGNPNGWNAACREIARALEDLTELWQVGPPLRDAANARGLFRWTDPRVSATSIGMNGETKVPTLDAILAVNRDADGPSIRPAVVAANAGQWREQPGLEFYVDFETVSNVNDDFSRIPEMGGQPLIFMIGCGHVEDGDWQFASFTADDLSEPAEGRMIDAWFAHMRTVRERFARGSDPRLIHWSAAEDSAFGTAYNAAVKRHPGNEWQDPNWFDFLTQVMRKEPVVVRGAMGFGLKAVARAMFQHGLIGTQWSDSITDGLGAMMAAWRSAEDAAMLGCRLADLPLMREVVKYNEVDCRVMWEIVAYLRAHH